MNSLTYIEQINALKNDGFTISATKEQQVIKILQRIGYSRLKQYAFQQSNTDILGIYDVYEFDRQLRLLLLEYLEKVEILMRTTIIHHHSQKYGLFGYLHADYHTNLTWHTDFINNLHRTLKRENETNLLIKLNRNELPITDSIEFFTFGMLSKFFNNMKTSDKKIINREFFGENSRLIQSWLQCLTHLRNKCAHYDRLYNRRFSQIPHNYHGSEFWNTVFDYILVLKLMLNDHSDWHGFVLKTENLIRIYRKSIDLSCLGFPENWNKLLIAN